MRIISTWFILFISIGVNAQSDTLFIEEYNLNALGQYKNGEPDGHWIYFYLNSGKQSEGDYKDGKLTGVWTNYFPSGQIEHEIIYRNDSMTTINKMYYEDGKQLNCNDFFFNAGDMLKKENYYPANVFFKKATELCPDNSLYWALSSLNKNMLGDNYGAIDDLDNSLTIEPNNAVYLTRRGEAYMITSQYDEAFKDISKSIEIDSGIITNYQLMGMVLAALKKHEQAIYYYTLFISKNTGKEDMHETLMSLKYRATCYFKLGEYKKAIEEYSLYLDVFTDDAEVYFYRAQSYLGLKNQKNACSDWKKAVQIDKKYLEQSNFNNICQ